MRSCPWFCALLVAGGCGGSAKPAAQDPAASDAAVDRESLYAHLPAAERQRAEEQEEAYQRRQAVQKERPEAPFEDRNVVGFRAKEKCGQGPYRLELDSLEARYGESLEVYVCGPRGVSGSYRLETERAHTIPTLTTPTPPSEGSFGYSRDNRECVAGAQERSVVAADRPSDGSGGGGGPPTGKGRAAAAGRKDKESAFRTLEAGEVPVDCRVKASVLHHSWRTDRGVALSPRARFTLEVWSEVPNHLEGAVFVVRQRAARADLTAEAWADYQRAEREWYRRYRALMDEDLRTGRATRVEPVAVAPRPPPPRAEVLPPRPSPGASWIPGAWHLEAGEYHWLAGLWRVPSEDISAERTARAPRPPPPPRAEPLRQRAAAPSPRAVWTPGAWQWDGRAFVWIEGVWRIPPEADQVWTPPVWEPFRGGVILRPGGWTIRQGGGRATPPARWR